jgi:succinate dehydrogenase / fumarate reductase, cytochrome b subunit
MMSSAPRTRPKYYDLNLAHLPVPGLVSIFHRVSGLLLFFPVLPVLLYMLQGAVGSPEDYAQVRDFFRAPLGKLITVGVIWLYAHHFWAGLRFLFLDLHWHVTKAPARKAALLVLVLGVLTTIAIAWRLFS